MDPRQNYLSQLHTYIEGIDKEVTLILHSLQWDRKHLLESLPVLTCKNDANHKMPPDKIESHERECFLKSQDYCTEDKMLPEPIDPNFITVIKFTTKDIKDIIKNASEKDTGFRKGKGSDAMEPLTDGRLRCVYTSDERRAIHDAAVCAAPTCHDLSDLALLGNVGDEQSTKPKSRMEVLAELRDMKRRRAKYRVAPKTKNYSDVLRDVIKTQMEFYTEAQGKSQHNSLNKNYKSNNSNNYSEPNANEFKDVNRKRQREESRENRSYPNKEKELSRDCSRQFERKHWEYSSRHSEHDKKRLSSDRKKEDESPNKRSREDSYRQSGSRHRSRDRNDGHRNSNSRDRFNQTHSSRSRQDKERDEHRNRHERRYEGQSGERDEHVRYSNEQSKDYYRRYNESRYTYNERRSSKDSRSTDNRKESSTNDRSYREIEIKTEIKEEYDSDEEEKRYEDAVEYSRSIHKKKKHKEHKRSSNSKERTTKLKKEAD